MPLCGSQNCGCAMTSAPSTVGGVRGSYPSLNVAGSGGPGDPWLLSLADAWLDEVAGQVTTFTPTWGNVTTTGATVEATYQYVADGMRIRISLTFGAGTAFTGNVSFTLPDSAVSRDDGVGSLGRAISEDSSSGSSDSGSAFIIANGSTVVLYASDGTAINATSPFTWTSGDELVIDITVPVA